MTENQWADLVRRLTAELHNASQENQTLRRLCGEASRMDLWSDRYSAGQIADLQERLARAERGK